jgi:hypothetical protein
MSLPSQGKWVTAFQLNVPLFRSSWIISFQYDSLFHVAHLLVLIHVISLTQLPFYDGRYFATQYIFVRINWLTNQPTNQSTNETTNQPTKQPTK